MIITGDIFPNGDREYVHPGRHCLDLNSLPTIKFNRFGTQDERNGPNAADLLAPKRLAYHYLAFAHDQPPGFSGSSGVASLPGMDTLVTLGPPRMGSKSGVESPGRNS